VLEISNVVREISVKAFVFFFQNQENRYFFVENGLVSHESKLGLLLSLLKKGTFYYSANRLLLSYSYVPQLRERFTVAKQVL